MPVGHRLACNQDVLFSGFLYDTFRFRAVPAVVRGRVQVKRGQITDNLLIAQQNKLFRAIFLHQIIQIGVFGNGAVRAHAAVFQFHTQRQGGGMQ